MKEDQRIGFHKDGQQEKVLGIDCTGEMNTEDLRKKILEVVSSESDYKQIVISGGTGWNHWRCIFLTEFIPIEKVKSALKRSEPGHPIRVYLTYKKPGYWIMEGNEKIIAHIKNSPKVIDFK